MSDSLQPQGLQPARLLCPWNSPGQNTGVGSCSFLQGIFPTQGSNPGLPHCSGFFTIWATREAQQRSENHKWWHRFEKTKTQESKIKQPQLRTEWRGLKADCCMLSHVWLFTTLWTVACQASLPCDLSGKKTKEDCHFLHQGIFPTKRSNPHFLCLLHCRWILYCWATGEAKSRLDAT